MLFNVGDSVLVDEPYGWHGRRYQKGTVRSVTASGRVRVGFHPESAYTVEFNPDGYQRGKRYGGMCLSPYDQTKLDEQARQDRLRAMRLDLQDTRWLEIPDDIAIAAHALLPKKPKD